MGVTKKRNYNAKEILTEYEKTLQNQQEKEDSSHVEPPQDVTTKEENESPLNLNIIPDDEYEDPDYEEYKRISLFMEFDVWERIQALCWNEKEAVNKTIVDHLRSWVMDVPDDIIENYRKDKKQQHLDQWTKERNLLQFWWNRCELRSTLEIQSYRMSQSTLTVVEKNGTVHNFYIHRNWITDGTQKYESTKNLMALMKRVR